MKRKITLIAVTLLVPLLLAAVLTACGGGESYNESPGESYGHSDAAAPTSVPDYTLSRDDFESQAENGGSAPESTSKDILNSGLLSGDPALLDPGRKIIRDVHVDMETLTYDDSVSKLDALLTELGGYMQSFEAEGATLGESGPYALRSTEFTLRIPAAKLDEFLPAVSGVGHVVSSSMTSEDVTDSYFDVEARIATLTLQEERILAILEKSTELTDVLELEATLSEVRYEIESLTATLRKYDGLISFSTVHLSLREVVQVTPEVVPEPEPEGIWGQIGSGFSSALTAVGDFFAAILVFVAGQSPILLLLALIGIGLYFWIRRLTRKAKVRAEARPPRPSPYPYVAPYAPYGVPGSYRTPTAQTPPAAAAAAPTSTTTTADPSPTAPPTDEPASSQTPPSPNGKPPQDNP